MGWSTISKQVTQVSLRPISTTTILPCLGLIVSSVRLRPAVITVPASIRMPSFSNSPTSVETVLGASSVFCAISIRDKPPFSITDSMMTWRFLCFMSFNPLLRNVPHLPSSKKLISNFKIVISIFEISECILPFSGRLCNICSNILCFSHLPSPIFSHSNQNSYFCDNDTCACETRLFPI